MLTEHERRLIKALLLAEHLGRKEPGVGVFMQPEPIEFTVHNIEIPETACHVPRNPPKPWGNKARRHNKFR